MSSIAGGIAVAVSGIAGAMNGGFSVARGTNELPDLCVGDAALRRRGRVLRDDAAGRWFTSIVVNPIDEFCWRNHCPDKVGGDERKAFAFVNGDGGAINAGSKAQAREFGSPKFKIGEVSAGQPATLFYVQKDDRAGRKAFAARGSSGRLRILGDALQRVRFVTQFPGSRSCKKQDKSKSLGAEKLAFTRPRVLFCAGRRTEPVACEGKGFAQNRKSGVAGVVVAIKTQVGMSLLRCRSRA